MFASLFFALATKLSAEVVASKPSVEVVATPLNQASKAHERDLIAKLSTAMGSREGCNLNIKERASLIFVLRFDKTGALSRFEPSYVPETTRDCLGERSAKIRLAPGAELGFAVNVTVE